MAEIVVDDERHLYDLRATYTQWLHELEIRSAAFGRSTPAHISAEMEDVQRAIAEIDGRLAALQPRAVG